MASGLLSTSNINEEALEKAEQLIIEAVPLSKYLNDHRDAFTDKWDMTEPGDGKMLCPNPEHEDSNPSYLYYDEQGTSNCFGCGLGGSVIAVNATIQRAYDPSYSNIRSIRYLARKYNVKIPDFMKSTHQLRKKHHAVVSQRQRNSSGTDDYYWVRVMELQQSIARVSDTNKKMEYYNIVDNMWLGRLTPHDAYLQLKGK